MTIPTERTNSLLQTKKLLESLLDPAATPRVPKEIRQRARGCLRHFPSAYEIELTAKHYPSLWGPMPGPSPSEVLAQKISESVSKLKAD